MTHSSSLVISSTLKFAFSLFLVCVAKPLAHFALSSALSQKNYFSAPQNTDPSGIIIGELSLFSVRSRQQANFASFEGHSHVVIEKIGSLTSTDLTDPQVFAFFKGLNAPATNGVLSTDVAGGLPAGVYKVSKLSLQTFSENLTEGIGILFTDVFDQ